MDIRPSKWRFLERSPPQSPHATSRMLSTLSLSNTISTQDTPPTPQRQPLTFLSLPPELRLLIYTYVFTPSLDLCWRGNYTETSYIQNLLLENNYAGHPRSLAVNILLTCRTFYEEALPLFYYLHHFRLTNFRDPMREYMRHLSIGHADRDHNRKRMFIHAGRRCITQAQMITYVDPCMRLESFVWHINVVPEPVPWYWSNVDILADLAGALGAAVCCGLWCLLWWTGKRAIGLGWVYGVPFVIGLMRNVRVIRLDGKLVVRRFMLFGNGNLGVFYPRIGVNKVI